MRFLIQSDRVNIVKSTFHLVLCFRYMFTQTFIIPPCSLLFEFFQQIQKIWNFSAKHRSDEENDVKSQNLALISFFSFKMLFFRQFTTLIYGNTYTKIFFSIFQTVVHFFKRKRNSFCRIAVEWPRRNKKSEGATSNKSWEIKLGRGTQAPLPRLIGRTSFHTQKNFVLDSDWTSYFSSDVNNILRSSDWLKLICVWKFTTQLTVLQCVYLNLQWNQVNEHQGDLS